MSLTELLLGCLVAYAVGAFIRGIIVWQVMERPAPREHDEHEQGLLP